MEVAAQWVHTWWTKESRSGSAAARRNRLPVAFPLPEVATPLTHTIVMKEWDDDFQPRSSVLHAPPERSEVAIEEEDSALRVMLVSAQPKNVIRRRHPAIRLRHGEWLRWQITYRHASLLGLGPWYYRLDTLNLAYGPVTADSFLGTPTRLVDERVQLTTYRRQGQST
ncbi:hypothetical protein NDR87_16685 [Nocardia sp. CDC159]|uniref:Uncharacterized protein n=1 Tax=Nocardia pulmonis TaxID=2951408 RepID=A0A9X2IY34_9NOCA|nr:MULTISPECIES: hypothetical protein [Nocardia]MCM6775269.1 hypothetical protein [Nocardia pulmonis]MCM6787997.1 hypothetical protein [Nocardia sp. CDC159]